MCEGWCGISRIFEAFLNLLDGGWYIVLYATCPTRANVVLGRTVRIECTALVTLIPYLATGLITRAKTVAPITSPSYPASRHVIRVPNGRDILARWISCVLWWCSHCLSLSNSYVGSELFNHWIEYIPVTTADITSNVYGYIVCWLTSSLPRRDRYLLTHVIISRHRYTYSHSVRKLGLHHLMRWA